MPRLSALIDDFAERFSFEKTKLSSLARSLREAGLITSGARGVNAPVATSLDAARLLIAMMLDSKLPTVVEDVRLVGGFIPIDLAQLTKGFAPTSLEDGLALLIEFAGRHSDFALDHDQITFTLMPYAALGVVNLIKDDQAAEISFSVPEVHLLPKEAFLGDLPDAYLKAYRRFPTGFFQKPEIRKENLIAVGQLVMGDSE